MTKFMLRLKFRFDFWRLSPRDKKIFRKLGIDPRSMIESGDL